MGLHSYFIMDKIIRYPHSIHISCKKRTVHNVDRRECNIGVFGYFNYAANYNVIY